MRLADPFLHDLGLVGGDLSLNAPSSATSEAYGSWPAIVLSSAKLNQVGPPRYSSATWPGRFVGPVKAGVPGAPKAQNRLWMIM